MGIARGRNCHAGNLIRTLHHVAKEEGKFEALFGGSLADVDEEEMNKVPGMAFPFLATHTTPAAPSAPLHLEPERGGNGDTISTSVSQANSHLIKQDGIRSDPGRLEAFFCFLLDHLSTEHLRFTPFVWEDNLGTHSSSPSIPHSLLDRLFGATLTTIEICAACQKCHEKKKRVLTFTVEYPPAPTPLSFSSLLQRMFSKTEQTKLICSFCDTLRDVTRTTFLSDFPCILSLSSAIGDDETKVKYWCASPARLPPHLLLQHTADHRRVAVEEFSERATGDVGGDVYELTHIVSRVIDSQSTSHVERVLGHYLAHIQVGSSGSVGDSPLRPSAHSMNFSAANWFLFNDISITHTNKTEAARCAHCLKSFTSA